MIYEFLNIKIFIGGGVDYNSGPYTVTFPIGITSVPFNITITNDIFYENMESFQVAIDPFLLPTWITVGYFGETNVTIMDEICKYNISKLIICKT